MGDLRHKVFSSDTLIPVGVILAIAAPVMGGTFWFGAKFADFSRDLTDVKTAVSKDRWTYSMEREVWNELKYLNPAIKTPDYSRIYTEHAKATQ
jgi:hypothetical protein